MRGVGDGMTPLSETDLAYFAGVLDNLGMLELREQKGRPKPHVEVRLAKRLLLDRFAAAFGGKVSTYRTKGHEHFYWRRTFSSARATVEALRPYLKNRAREADRILHWHAVPRGHRRNARIAPMRASELSAGASA